MVVQNLKTINQRLTMMTNNPNKVKFRKEFATYLLELTKLTGIDINSEVLSSLDEVERIRRNTNVLANANTTNFVIKFSDKNSDKFSKFIKSLKKANSHPVYVWTQSANLFGLYKADSIDAIDFAFPFDVNTSGIVNFLAEDLNDELLFDFYHDPQNQEMLEVELKGKHWPSIIY